MLLSATSHRAGHFLAHRPAGTRVVRAAAALLPVFNLPPYDPRHIIPEDRLAAGAWIVALLRLPSLEPDVDARLIPSYITSYVDGLVRGLHAS